MVIGWALWDLWNKKVLESAQNAIWFRRFIITKGIVKKQEQQYNGKQKCLMEIHKVLF